MQQRTVWVCFPTAPYTHESALRAANKVLARQGWRIVEGGEEAPTDADVYFGDYDLLPFEKVHPASNDISDCMPCFPQLSSYVIRKSLIRKNYLAHSLHVAHVKGTSMAKGVSKLHRTDTAQSISPTTWTFEATCAEDLDELLADDLYDVRLALTQNVEQQNNDAQRMWFIIKPAMADQGMGIRLFDTVEALEEIFEEFEEVSDDEEEENDNDDADDDSYNHRRNNDRSTAVVTSQVRQFVIQEYLANPLLVRAPTLSGLHKFHIRAYVLSQANLRVFLYDEMLALFAPTPYTCPGGNGDAASHCDLTCHLTNTSRQDDEQSERTVHLLSDLLGCHIGSIDAEDGEQHILTQAHMDGIRLGAAATIAEAFHAATIAGRVHFQPWPNAWEIFGVDLMVTVTSSSSGSLLPPRVWLLEINAQPDFAKTGAALQAKIDRLFERALEITALGDDGLKVGKNDLQEPSTWQPGTSRDQMTLCLDMPMSAGGW